jgi:hypothetical protein
LDAALGLRAPDLRSLLAIGAGFLTLVLLISLATALMRRFWPQWTIPWEREAPTAHADPARIPEAASRIGMAVNLAASMIFAAAGGAVTAWYAPAGPLIHALILSLVVLILSALAAYDLARRTTAIYTLALLALTPMATLGGGILVTLLR